MSATRPSAVVVLAAGEGKRMRSTVPKVLHEAGGRSLLGHVLHAARDLQPTHLVVVVGHGRDYVVEHLTMIAPEALVAVQEEQHGTGHAVRVGLAALPELDGTVVVTAADTPLLTSTTLRALLEDHRRAAAAATVLTAELDDPYLGRVLRAGDGSVLGIVEARDASAEQLGVREVNSGIYAFAAADLTSALGRLTRDNAQGEEYLTDVLGLLRREGRVVAASQAVDASEITGVNDRIQLADAGRLVYARTVRRWQLAGVTVVDPATTWIGPEVELEPDVTLLPGVHLEGRTTVASHAVIGPDTTLRHCQVAEGATVVRSHAVGAAVGAGASVGPYSFLRPGTSLGRDSKVGAYVEIKGSTLGAGSKVPHLSYVGDAEIGEGTNIGAATVFVNYDGVEKHRTVVGDHVRIGSDTMLVAPLTVGDGAYTAAGSVITEDVPPGAMGVGRARQRVIEGWVERRRAGTPSAEAAGRARASAGTPGTGESADTAESKDEQATAEGQDA